MSSDHKFGFPLGKSHRFGQHLEEKRDSYLKSTSQTECALLEESEDNQVKFRHEMKFICSDITLKLLAFRIQPLIDVDRHSDARGGYTVNSLYFDDYLNSCCHDNDLGIGSRYKYRIRYYGDSFVNGPLRLEKKEKNNELGRKFSCLLSLDEFECLMHGDVHGLIRRTDEPLLKELCLNMQLRRFTPKIIVRYEREAYLTAAGNVRITFDRNCAASNQVEHFLLGDGIMCPMQVAGEHLLEVKYDEFLPGYIQQTLQVNTLRQTPFSKYYLGRQTCPTYRM